MTVNDLAKLIFPDVQKSLSEYHGEESALIHLARPFWFLGTKVSIGVAVALLQPKVQPLLPYLNDLLPLIPAEQQAFCKGFLELMVLPKKDLELE